MRSRCSKSHTPFPRNLCAPSASCLWQQPTARAHSRSSTLSPRVSRSCPTCCAPGIFSARPRATVPSKRGGGRAALIGRTRFPRPMDDALPYAVAEHRVSRCGTGRRRARAVSRRRALIVVLQGHSQRERWSAGASGSAVGGGRKGTDTVRLYCTAPRKSSSGPCAYRTCAPRSRCVCSHPKFPCHPRAIFLARSSRPGRVPARVS